MTGSSNISPIVDSSHMSCNISCEKKLADLHVESEKKNVFLKVYNLQDRVISQKLFDKERP